jgi:steroid 5-alpha reductase family enzyme
MTRSRPFEIPVGYPDLQDDPIRGRRNLTNLALALCVPIPAFVFTIALFRWFEGAPMPADPGLVWPDSLDETAALLLHHPLLTANLLFFLFVDLHFWLIALFQRSSWLIDPYWTLLPPLLAWFYLAHPMSTPGTGRAALAVGVLLVWSVRPTWSYFRRERWRFGYREDWRYAKMRLERPHFWLEQLFWWSIAGFGLVCGELWVAIGAALNSTVLAAVTIMTERRMLAVPERRVAFEAYRRRTSVLIPWWSRPLPHTRANSNGSSQE